MATSAFIPPQSTQRVLKFISPAPEILQMNAHKQKVTLQENHPWEVSVNGTGADYHAMKEAGSRFLRTAEGAYRFTQFGDKFAKFINTALPYCGFSPLSSLDKFSDRSRMGWVWCTTFPRTLEMTPGTIRDVQEAAAAVKDETLPTEQIKYKVARAFMSVTDAVAMYCHSLNMISGLFPNTNAIGKTLANAADTTTLAHDVTSLSLNGQNYLRARAIDLTKATAQIKQTIEETKTCSSLAILKDISAIASGVFGLVFLVTGIAYAPAIVLATLSLASTVFAVIRTMYQETMMFKPINFFDNKHVTLVTV